jgi:HNH endonuclease
MYERRPVPGYPRWEADTNGDVYLDNLPADIFIAKHDAYVYIRGYQLKGEPAMKRATLVALAFHGPKPPNKQVCAHRNDIKEDDKPENLYWATHGENYADARRNGRPLPGLKKEISCL